MTPILQDGRERVTAGLPALSPSLRQKIEEHRRQRAEMRQYLLNELEREVTDLEDGGAQTTNLLAQMGRSLSAIEVIRRLKKINPYLHFERSIAEPHKMCVYQIREGQRHLVCAMPAEYVPEFTVRHVSTERVPDPDIRGHWKKVQQPTGITAGWRRTLAMLLRSGLIRPCEIEEHFQVAAGRTSKSWQALTT